MLDRQQWTGAPVPTFSGRLVHPLAPDPETIVIEDIAHHLAAVNRFNGATLMPYSVAQHSVLVSCCCDPVDSLHGLLHDAAEAYMGELVKPVKELGLLRAYRVIETHLLAAIYCRFGLAPGTPPSVMLMDERIAATEARDLFVPAAVPHFARVESEPMPRPIIEPWSARCAEEQFLNRFERLRSRS
jgi:hypothetical protein